MVPSSTRVERRVVCMMETKEIRLAKGTQDDIEKKQRILQTNPRPQAAGVFKRIDYRTCGWPASFKELYYVV